MQLSELTPEHIENATIKDLEKIGLSADLIAMIREKGLRFKWDIGAGRYMAEIPTGRKRKPTTKR